MPRKDWTVYVWYIKMTLTKFLKLFVELENYCHMFWGILVINYYSAPVLYNKFLSKLINLIFNICTKIEPTCSCW